MNFGNGLFLRPPDCSSFASFLLGTFISAQTCFFVPLVVMTPPRIDTSVLFLFGCFSPRHLRTCFFDYFPWNLHPRHHKSNYWSLARGLGGPGTGIGTCIILVGDAGMNCLALMWCSRKKSSCVLACFFGTSAFAGLAPSNLALKKLKCFLWEVYCWKVSLLASSSSLILSVMLGLSVRNRTGSSD